MLVIGATKCSLKEPNQGYCMATLWTQNYGWGEKYESVSWCHAGCQCVVYCGEWCFLTEQREPPSPLPQLYCTCTGWGSPCHSAHRRLFKQKTSLTALNSLHFFLLFKPTHTHKMSIASQWQPKKKKNLKILYMQLIWKLTQLTMKYFVSLTCKASWKKITWFFLLKTYLHSLYGDSKFVERHCSMAQEVSIGMEAETCKREKPWFILSKGPAWNAFIIYAGEAAC